LWAVMGSLPNTIEYSARRLTQANLALPALWLMTVAYAVIRRERQLLSLAVLTASIFVLTAFQVYSGTLPSLHRYWGYATLLAIILAGACAQAISRSSRRAGLGFSALASVLLLGGVVSSPFQLGALDGGVD